MFSVKWMFELILITVICFQCTFAEPDEKCPDDCNDRKELINDERLNTLEAWSLTAGPGKLPPKRAGPADLSDAISIGRHSNRELILKSGQKFCVECASGSKIQPYDGELSVTLKFGDILHYEDEVGNKLWSYFAKKRGVLRALMIKIRKVQKFCVHVKGALGLWILQGLHLKVCYNRKHGKDSTTEPENSTPDTPDSITEPKSSKLDTPAQCPNGSIPDGKVCCPATCGRCGGDGCSTRPGGVHSCCYSVILNNNVSCTVSDAPCVLTKDSRTKPESSTMPDTSGIPPFNLDNSETTSSPLNETYYFTFAINITVLPESTDSSTVFPLMSTTAAPTTTTAAPTTTTAVHTTTAAPTTTTVVHTTTVAPTTAESTTTAVPTTTTAAPTTTAEPTTTTATPNTSTEPTTTTTAPTTTATPTTTAAESETTTVATTTTTDSSHRRGNPPAPISTLSTMTETTTSDICVPHQEKPLSSDQITFIKESGSALINSWFGAFDYFFAANGTADLGAPDIKRKEYRHMTEEEVKAFNDAVNKVKVSGVYDRFVEYHSPVKSRAAHRGVAFLPWHRHFLYLFEQELRKESMSVTLPYWDSALDYPLPKPQDSAIWTKDFWGNNFGPVKSGPFAGWKVNMECQAISKKLKRSITNRKELLYSKSKIEKIMTTAQNYAELLLLQEEANGEHSLSDFESDHGGVHCWVGTCLAGGKCTGHMGCVPCSPSDPVFWMHHGFVDYLWDEWKAEGGDNTYPDDFRHADVTLKELGGPNHRKDAELAPFPGLENQDGFRGNFYPGYEERPSKITCFKDPDCKSPTGLLWCDLKKCCCVGKVKEGGKCTGLPDNACYCKEGKMSKCKRGKCVCK